MKKSSDFKRIRAKYNKCDVKTNRLMHVKHKHKFNCLFKLIKKLVSAFIEKKKHGRTGEKA